MTPRRVVALLPNGRSSRHRRRPIRTGRRAAFVKSTRRPFDRELPDRCGAQRRAATEDTMARLNELFVIVVPAIVEAGGHVIIFLGDGAIAVFSAPDLLPGHAVAAFAAISIQRGVTERFRSEVPIGFGINTGEAIATTISAAGHLEFATIADTTDVEHLINTTRRHHPVHRELRRCFDDAPIGAHRPGVHSFKGKTASTRVYRIDAATTCTDHRALCGRSTSRERTLIGPPKC